MYAVLAEKGYFEKDELKKLRKIEGMLQGHPDMQKTPGIDMSTGSLGQGLSVANGMALASKLNHEGVRVYCVCGDGEIQEGQIWEAAMTSSHRKLDNLCLIVDNNNLQIDGNVDTVKNIYPLDEKFKSFGFEVIKVDGHDIEKLIKAFDKAKTIKEKPTVIIAKTIKGKGVSFMENKADWHGKAPNEEQYKFDIFKMKHIMKQIKKKTMSLKMNALNICLDISKKVDKGNVKNIETIGAESLNDIKKNDDLTKVFPNIKDNLLESNDGLELIINVTNDINEKTESENKKFYDVFAPKKIIFTNIISLICIIMYIIVGIYGNNFLNFDANILAIFGANNIILIKNGEIWRLLTCAFLHVGLIHLLVNMYSLIVIGPSVEGLIGKGKFVFIYLISAISASLMSLVFVDSNIVSVGASGAIFGLMGALLYFGYHYRLYLNDAIKTQIIPVILFNLVIGFMMPGIDNGAHIGGLIGGYLATMAIGIKNKSTKKDMINGWIVLILYLAFLSYVVFFVK